METARLLNDLERCKTLVEARTLLKPHNGAAGLSKAFFERVFSHFVSQPGKAYRLAGHWKAIAELGDQPSYAYRAKAVADRGRGDWAASARSFMRAGELADDPVEKLSFQTGAVDALAHSKRMKEAEELANKLVDGLRKLSRPDLAARVLLNLGNALVIQDRMIEARKHLESALPEIQRAGLEQETISGLLALSSTHLFAGDIRIASELAEQTLRRAREAGIDYAATIAEMNLAHAKLLSGRPDEALDRFLALRENLADDPIELTRVLEFAGDAYYHLNLWPEAIDSYREAMSRTRSIQPSHAANVRLGIGLSLLAVDRPEESLPYFSDAKRRYASLKNRPWASACLIGKARAFTALGKSSQAKRAAREARQLSGKSAYHWCETVLLAAELGLPDHQLSKAAGLIHRYGFKSLEWRVHHLRAGKAASRLLHYRRMLGSILEGRLATTSLISRASYLKNKSEPIREYLGCLLESPTPKRVDEAISVIEQTRSVALIDEILSSIRNPGLLERLEGLRQDIQTASVRDEHPGSRRNLGLEPIPNTARRKWTDIVRSARAVVEELPRSETSHTVVLTQAGDRLFALFHGECIPLQAPASELARKLKWMQYELMSPMLDPDADPTGAIADLCSMAREALDPWARPFEGLFTAVCPDGVMWQVPWQTLIALDRPTSALDTVLHPQFTSSQDSKLPDGAKSLLWVSESADLPHGLEEAEEFRSRFPSTRVCRSARQALESLNEEYEVVHVVAHARHREENPMFSSIEFADGPVYASEIARSGLRAKLVTLAACDTGALSLVSKEEPDGLARAFLARGASNVIASAWALHDEASAKAFSRFYQALNSGVPVRDALVQARCEVRNWREHPYYWGSLTLYRGYRS